jgi:hypothetical protein
MVMTAMAPNEVTTKLQPLEMDPPHSSTLSAKMHHPTKKPRRLVV